MLSDAHENWLTLYFNIKLSTRPFKMMQTDATSGQKTEKLHFLLMKCHMLSCQWNQTLEQVKINETHFWIYFAFCCRGFLLRSRYNSPWGINIVEGLLENSYLAQTNLISFYLHRCCPNSVDSLCNFVHYMWTVCWSDEYKLEKVSLNVYRTQSL